MTVSVSLITASFMSFDKFLSINLREQFMFSLFHDVCLFASYLQPNSHGSLMVLFCVLLLATVDWNEYSRRQLNATLATDWMM